MDRVSSRLRARTPALPVIRALTYARASGRLRSRTMSAARPFPQTNVRGWEGPPKESRGKSCPSKAYRQPKSKMFCRVRKGKEGPAARRSPRRFLPHFGNPARLTVVEFRLPIGNWNCASLRWLCGPSSRWVCLYRLSFNYQAWQIFSKHLPDISP